MRKPLDTAASFRRALAVAALALATAALAPGAASAREMDPPGADQPQTPQGKEERGRGRGRESAPPRQDPRAEGRDPRSSPVFGGAPPAAAVQAAPRERAEAREREERHERAELRQEYRPRPGVTFGASRGPEVRVAPPPRAYGYRAPPPERIVPRLPPGYRQYYWSGSPYYSFGGHWYRPYGSSFLIVGAPLGLFVPYLPSYYSTVWIGGTRYYVADDTYYVYDPVRRGYIVTRSPYGGDDRDDDYDAAPSASTELFIYPTRGQSEQQQAEDRYQCHRWAVDQSHYDPTESEYRAADRAEYDRALTACLTGRGYSVK